MKYFLHFFRYIVSLHQTVLKNLFRKSRLNILQRQRLTQTVHTTASESSLSEPTSGGSGLQGTGKPLAKWYIYHFFFIVINFLIQIHATFCQPEIWQTLPLDPVLLEAKKDKKPVLILFEAPWNETSYRFAEEVLNNTAIKTELENYHLVRVDGDDKGVGSQSARKFGVDTLPCVFFLNEEGIAYNSVSGYIETPAFAKVLKENRKPVLDDSITKILEVMANPVETARKETQPLLFIVYTSWSSSYSEYKEKTMKDPILKELENHFVVYKIDGDTLSGKSIVKSLQIEKFPAIYCFGPDGKIGDIEGISSRDEIFQFYTYWYNTWRWQKHKQTKILPKEAFSHGFEPELKKKRKELKDVFMLRTGRAIEGKAVWFRDNLVAISKDGQESLIPLHMFTPGSRRPVYMQALAYMQEISSLVPGPYPLEFQRLKTFMDISTTKEAATSGPVVLLIDPAETLTKALKERFYEDKEAENNMTWIKKFLMGKELSQVVIGQITSVYKMEFPGVLILEKGTPNEMISPVQTADEFLKMLEDYNLLEKK